MNGGCKTQAPSIFSARRLGLSPAFKVMSKASVLREFGGAQKALTLMGEGAQAALAACVFLESRLSKPPAQRKGDALWGMPCGLSDSPGFSETLLLEMNRVILENPCFVTH